LWQGFAFGGEKLLHQPFFMGIERGELLRLQGDHFVEGSEAVGDFLLFAGLSVWVGNYLGLKDREVPLVLF